MGGRAAPAETLGTVSGRGGRIGRQRDPGRLPVGGRGREQALPGTASRRGQPGAHHRLDERARRLIPSLHSEGEGTGTRDEVGESQGDGAEGGTRGRTGCVEPGGASSLRDTVTSRVGMEGKRALQTAAPDGDGVSCS